MGSSGSKPRKKKKSQGKANHSQHLPKVGTATENERLLHEEQHAVASQMGMGNMSSSTKTIVMGVVIFIVVVAILGLIGLNTFH
jgi:hypothetical protein